jgi:hypothetical protein
MVNFSVRTLSLLDKALVLGVVATLAACGSNALGPERGAEGRRSAADDGTPFYYYDHQPIYLTVDSARMVVLPNDALAADSVSVRDAVQARLARYGLQIDLLQSLGPPPFHWLVQLSGYVNADTAAVARAELVSAPELRAVIPAYRSVDGGVPVFVLNRVVARFKDGVSRGQIDGLVASLGAEVIRVQDAGSGYVTYLIEPSPGSHGDVLKIANAIDESSIALWGSPDMVHPAMGPTSLLGTE